MSQNGGRDSSSCYSKQYLLSLLGLFPFFSVESFNQKGYLLPVHYTCGFAMVSKQKNKFLFFISSVIVLTHLCARIIEVILGSD